MSKRTCWFRSIADGCSTLAKISISVQEGNEWMDAVKVEMVTAADVSARQYRMLAGG
jgi:hypothetical protein